jgi:hypothetical protein
MALMEQQHSVCLRHLQHHDSAAAAPEDRLQPFVCRTVYTCKARIANASMEGYLPNIIMATIRPVVNIAILTATVCVRVTLTKGPARCMCAPSES